jgi:peptidylamidoglycolate lyase
MTVIKNKGWLVVFAGIFFIACNDVENTNRKFVGKQLPNYQLVKDWPQLPKEYTLSQVTGVGIDTDGNIFLFHRNGRQWTEPFPDSLISSTTILMLDRQTGKLLSSWGANLFIMPHGLTVDKDNNVWVTDVALQQVFKFSHDGKLLMKLGIAKVAGDDAAHFNLPTDVAVANDGSFYVSDGYGNSRVVKFSAEGKYLFEWGKRSDNQGEFNTPHGIDVDRDGNVYVADRDNNRIQKFDAKGKSLITWKNDMAVQLYSLSIDKQNNELFAIDYLTIGDVLIKGSDIIQFDSTMKLLTRFGRSGFYDGKKCRYHDIAVDRDGSIYVGDILGNRIQKFKKVAK